MTRALFLAPPGALDELGASNAFTLGGTEGRHAVVVRRIRPGEWVDIGDGAGTVASCEVVSAERDLLQVRVGSIVHVSSPAVSLTLVQALAKGGRDEQAVETATEAGVDVVVPWQASRSIVRWDGERGTKALHRWSSVAREASKQSRRAWVPVIETLVTTRDLAARIAEADLALILHESAKQPIAEISVPASGEVLVVVGPEGGITDDEIAELTRAGGVAARLGPEVLRASTAGPIALAYLAARLGRWSSPSD